jgi:hypothetical protein
MTGVERKIGHNSTTMDPITVRQDENRKVIPTIGIKHIKSRKQSQNHAKKFK